MDNRAVVGGTGTPAWVCVGAALLVGLAFAGALDNEFVDWDDGPYIVHNPMVAEPSRYTWLDRLRTANLGYPLPIVVAVYGWVWRWSVDPVAFHTVGLVVHAANAALVARAASFEGRWRQGIVAAWAFALHPVVVEAAVWASGLKDTLMCAAVLGSFALFPRRPLLGAVLAVLAMGCKPSASLVGLALLALAIQRRLSRRAHGLAAAVLGTGILYAMFVMSTETADLRTSALVEPSVHRALGALGLTLEHLLVPASLSPRYPVAAVGLGSLTLGAFGVAASAWWGWRSGIRHPTTPWLVLAWAIYLPVSNLRPLERFTADSYAYVPWAALVLAIVHLQPLRWLKAAVADRWPHVRAAGLVVGLAWSALTVVQVEVWQSTLALWRSAMARFPDDGETVYRYGDALRRRGEARAELALYLEHLEALSDAPRIPAALLRWYAHHEDHREFRRWARLACERPVRQPDGVYVELLRYLSQFPVQHQPAYAAALRYAWGRWREGSLEVSLTAAQQQTLRGLVAQ
ncbi:MAG: hypothetical protein B7733_22285 [Myxococcales bacterium FL481]|nr:MAG: hypothetical protein B7733_22285 [Myxococcales bacterium FL481]